MRTYIRPHQAAASYFFTVNLAERKGNDLLVRHIDALRMAVRTTRDKYPFTIDAICVLPDHIHAVWTLPIEDGDFSLRWRLIKTHFSRALPSIERVSESRQRKDERGIWQRRFWEHRIRDDVDYARHVDYTHFNPVKHGLVKNAVDWPYSSLHRWIREGRLPAGWGCGDNGVMDLGELE